MATDEIVVSFPTLGPLIADWVEAHCPVPDGFDMGRPFTMYPWQLEATCNHYGVRHRAKVGQRSTAFHYRRSQVIGPQKLGKGPWAATIVAAEGVGPVLFDGWAGRDDGFSCSTWGCGCGWEWAYEPGEPMGRPWPTPLIQLLATAEDQVDNVYRPLQSMIRNGPLGDRMRVGEEFVRLPNSGRIDVVTSSATARLGQQITFALQDETGLYTKSNGMVRVAETQRRGLAGMSGRAIETSNAWDPTQDSVAQRTADAATKQPDIYRYHRLPDPNLKYKVKADRRRIHKHVYHGAPHVDLDGIEAEAAELVLVDLAQAERFFGNRPTAGSSKWTTDEKWMRFAVDEPLQVARGDLVVLGFDGSDGTTHGDHRVADSTVLRACRLSDGYRWTPRRPDGQPAVWEHERDSERQALKEWWVPRAEVMETIRQCFADYKVVLAGFDPPYWRTEISELTEEFGSDRIIEFKTSNEQLMSAALERLDQTDTPHDGCSAVRQHAVNAVAIVKEYRDDNDERRRRVLVSKASKDSPDKIDGVISDAIALDMRDRAVAAGARKKRTARLVTFR